jgi:hypothetical protein
MVSISGNSLQALAQACAAELGPFAAFGATSNSGAANLVVASSQIDTEAPVEKYAGYYLFSVSGTNAGQQGRVKRNGFTGASGTFTVAANFTGTPQSGDVWELHGVIPRVNQDGLIGLRTCVNRALRKLWMRYWVPFTGVSGQTSYDLGALWWAHRSRFIRLMDPDPAGTGHPPVATQAWDVVQNADTWTLQLGEGYATGETFWLVVECPTNYRLYISGAWANQSSPTAGMVAEADACLGSWNDVFQCCLYECMKQLTVQAGGNRKAYWEGRLAAQANIVSQINLYSLNDDGVALGEGPTNSPDLSSNRGAKSWWAL